MGVIFGIINIIVVVWFFASAASVKKQALMWAVIGGLAFLGFKFVGYSVIGLLQGSADQAIISDLVDKGYTPSERTAIELDSENSNDQSTFLGILFEFFPLIVALAGVAYIRAKFILGMGFVDSLKHKTSIKLTTKNAFETPEAESAGFTDTIISLWKKIKPN